jgi:hypothetical protein
VWFGLTSLVFGFILLHVAPLGARTTRAAVALLLLVAFAVLNVFASVQLWRLRESGRKAALGACLVGAALVFVQFQSLGALEVGRLALTGLLMVVLLLPSAKRACGP